VQIPELTALLRDHVHRYVQVRYQAPNSALIVSFTGYILAVATPIAIGDPRQVPPTVMTIPVFVDDGRIYFVTPVNCSITVVTPPHPLSDAELHSLTRAWLALLKHLPPR